MRRSSLGLLVLALVHVTCNQVILTAPPGSSLSLFANPQFIPAHGGISIISALVIEPAGTPVPDGTVVQFFTNLGSIDEQGKTNDGVARVNLVSDARSGTAHVVATSGGGAAPAPTPSGSPSPPTTTGGSGTGSVDVTVGSETPTRVLLTANPSRITSDSRSTHIAAMVFDAHGNPVANVPVIFTVAPPSSDPLAYEFMDSEGRPVFTDNNGRAEDVMRTRYPRDAAQRDVTVTATVPGPGSTFITGTVVVPINAPGP
jgi:hypothetical protein